MEKQGCAALNLSKIMDMQTRLRHNLEAIGMLNQQVSTHQVLAVLLPDRYKHIPTQRPTCCWVHTEEEAFMCPTSKAHLHTGAHRHPFPLPAIKVESAAVWGCVRRAGEGGQIVSGKKQWRFSPLVNDFPFMKVRVGCISIQPRWSLHDSIGKWPAVIKQWGGKNTEEYSREMLTFFTALNFTRVNKSPKERQIKSTPQPPQFCKTPGPGERLTRLFLVCGMARWLTEYEEGWHLLKFLMQCCLLLLLLKSKWHQPHVRERGGEGGTEEEADEPKDRGVV